jgi:F-type H+-transporting ATPase subunit b
MHLPLLLAASVVDVRPGLIFWTLITFIIVAFVLRRTAWGPILNVVEEREKQISNAVEAAKKERAEAEKLLAEQKAQAVQARKEAADLMRKNQEDVERLRQELLTKARAEAESARADATRAIADEKAKALVEVKKVAADLAVEIADKLIGTRMDPTQQKNLASQFIAELSQKPSGEAGHRA